MKFTPSRTLFGVLVVGYITLLAALIFQIGHDDTPLAVDELRNVARTEGPCVVGVLRRYDTVITQREVSIARKSCENGELIEAQKEVLK
ncbi:hypothetical protein [Brucella cytisi]|uniref:Uncharacterized protein n=1 Tax=Brucella cytisi TaxID=407152 RepID=A0A1J6HAS8_9HYPH|nr:hypothetical protein [Brucella cytisi]OIS90213.1 hypothetical protein BLA27_27990 [Brucella cytisi]